MFVLIFVCYVIVISDRRLHSQVSQISQLAVPLLLSFRPLVNSLDYSECNSLLSSSSLLVISHLLLKYCYIITLFAVLIKIISLVI